jgi:hypothetical protein
MRLLILLAALALIAAVVIMLYYAFSTGPVERGEGGRGGGREGGRQLRPETHWEPHTESSGGVTTVLVRQITSGGRELGRQVIDTIPDAEPDWEGRYHEAMAQARSRVAALRIEGD